MKRKKFRCFVLTLFLLFSVFEGCSIQNTKPNYLNQKSNIDVNRFVITLLSIYKPLSSEITDFNLENFVRLDNHEAFLDVDTGKITNDPSADIYLDYSCGSDCFITLFSINGAQAIGIGFDRASREECSNLLEDPDDSNRIFHNRFLDPVPGHYSCILTNDGNITRILILKSDEGAVGKVTIQYTLSP